MYNDLTLERMKKYKFQEECFWCHKKFLKTHARYYKNPFYETKAFCSKKHKLEWISSISNF